MFCKGVYTLLITLCICLIGCSNQVRDELLIYVNDGLSGLLDAESAAIEAFESVRGENYTDDEQLYSVLTQTVIPIYTKFVEDLEALAAKLKTEEVRKLHEKYIEGANMQNSALITLKIALEEGDSNKVLIANDKLTQGRKMVREWIAALDDLCDKYDIQWEDS